MKKSKAVKIRVSGIEKAKQAIAALEISKKNAQKSGRMRQTNGQKMADIKDIQIKIDAWKLKYPELA